MSLSWHPIAAKASPARSCQHCCALAVLLDHNRRRAIGMDVDRVAARAHDVHPLSADQLMMLDEIADLSKPPRVKIAHEGVLPMLAPPLPSSHSVATTGPVMPTRVAGMERL
jgi:hypothetical protein